MDSTVKLEKSIKIILTAPAVAGMVGGGEMSLGGLGLRRKRGILNYEWWNQNDESMTNEQMTKCDSMGKTIACPADRRGHPTEKNPTFPCGAYGDGGTVD